MPSIMDGLSHLRLLPHNDLVKLPVMPPVAPMLAKSVPMVPATGS
jgi:hypothetical protein